MDPFRWHPPPEFQGAAGRQAGGSRSRGGGRERHGGQRRSPHPSRPGLLARPGAHQARPRTLLRSGGRAHDALRRRPARRHGALSRRGDGWRESPQGQRALGRLLLPQASGRGFPRSDGPGDDHRIGGSGALLTITSRAASQPSRRWACSRSTSGDPRGPTSSGPTWSCSISTRGRAWTGPRLADGARLVRKVLQTVRLESFVKTTGGKGLHVVAPLRLTRAGRTWSSSAAGSPRSWWSCRPTASPPTCPKPSARARST